MRSSDKCGISRLEFRSSWGSILVYAHSGRIVSCKLPRLDTAPAHPFELNGMGYRFFSDEDRGVLELAECFLSGYFTGTNDPIPALGKPSGSIFRRNVRRVLEGIPEGELITYGDLARMAGSPGAARAAGSACAANELPVFVPCHRVVASDGRLGGFSCGLAWKQYMINLERKF